MLYTFIPLSFLESYISRFHLNDVAREPRISPPPVSPYVVEVYEKYAQRGEANRALYVERDALLEVTEG